jgi:hypothetical protein
MEALVNGSEESARMTIWVLLVWVCNSHGYGGCAVYEPMKFLNEETCKSAATQIRGNEIGRMAYAICFGVKE